MRRFRSPFCTGLARECWLWRSCCGGATAEADDIAIEVLDVEVLRAPGSRLKRLDDCYAIRCALRIERFDAINTNCGARDVTPGFVLIVVMSLRFSNVVLRCTSAVRPSTVIDGKCAHPNNPTETD